MVNFPISLSVEQKIKHEKRRRNQIYNMLDYLLSLVTYFDFFSLDSFKILKNSLNLTKISKEEKVTLDIFFLSFFDSNLELFSFLKEFGLDEEFLEELLPSFILKDTSNLLFNVLTVKEDKKLGKEIEFSYDLHKIFEKASENSLIRFKTPVITPEILFLTLLEQSNSKISKVLKKALGSKVNWYLFRYTLIKRIHFQESIIRGEINKSKHYFAYLLKLHLTEIEFKRLIENQLLETGINLFRNSLISEILKANFFDSLNLDIKNSMKIVNNRKYSS